jgi:hypothetical protein
MTTADDGSGRCWPQQRGCFGAFMTMMATTDCERCRVAAVAEARPNPLAQVIDPTIRWLAFTIVPFPLLVLKSFEQSPRLFVS